MTAPAIITVAITGSVPRKKNTPAVPVEPVEQVESTHEAFEAGAALVHIHVRDAQEDPSSDPERFAKVIEGVRRHCRGMIVQVSTGGRGRSHEQRGSPIPLGPDMASLTTGSVNFATMIYENPPELIDHLAQAMLEHEVKPEMEIFDLAMLYNTRRLIERGLARPPAHIQFVLGIPNALPAEEAVLDLLLREKDRVLPDATWSCAGIGRHQLPANRWTLARGGHPRTGLEDNIYKAKGVLAQSNAELVTMTVGLCADHDRHPASPAEARIILGLPPA